MGFFSRLSQTLQGQTAEPLTPDQLDLPETATTPDGRVFHFQSDGELEIEIDIVGESHYQNFIRSIYEIKKNERFAIYLVPELDNQYDKYAVKVETAGQKIGYISKDISKPWSKVCLEYLEKGLILNGSAKVFSRDGKIFGVFGYIKLPRQMSRPYQDIEAKALTLAQLKAISEKLGELSDSEPESLPQIKSHAKKSVKIAEQLIGHVKAVETEDENDDELGSLLEEVSNFADQTLDDSEDCVFVEPEDGSPVLDAVASLNDAVEELISYLVAKKGEEPTK